MDHTARQQIDVICDKLHALRVMASDDGHGLLAYLISEAIEEAELIRKAVSLAQNKRE